MATRARGTPNAAATNSTRAALALPSTGGALQADTQALAVPTGDLAAGGARLHAHVEHQSFPSRRPAGHASPPQRSRICSA